MTIRIHTIDLDYLGTAGAIAVYVLVGPDGPVLIETGPACTTDALERGLNELGFAVTDVRDVLVTHIHFDHAGASGWLAQRGARIHVHDFGRVHLVDPTRLVSSARRVYGDEMERRWGTPVPIPEAQVRPLHDRDVVEAGGMKIFAMETPGHARHHNAYVVDTGRGRVAFTGDVAATFVEDCPEFISVPTPPPEFELGAWLASLHRIGRERLVQLYPTHFGPVDDITGHLQRVRYAVRQHADFVHGLLRRGGDEPTLRQRYTDWFVEQAKEAGLPSRKLGFYVLDTMADMNFTGLVRYWGRMDEEQATERRSDEATEG